MSLVNYTREQIIALAAQKGIVLTGSGTSSVTYADSITSQVKGTSSFSSGATNTSNTTQIIDGICEGPIHGFPTTESLKHIYLDGTPVKSYNNTINVGDLRCEFKTGTSNQLPLSQYTIIGAVKSPNWLNEIDDINKPSTTGAIIQQVQIRDDTDGAYPPVEAVAFTFTFPEGLFRTQTSGGRDSTPCGIKIELNNRADGSGDWVTKLYDLWNQEITGGDFEVTYILEIPPGWATIAGLQEYSDPAYVDDIIQFRISKFDSDYTNERAHSKLYLKNYSIYTRNQFSFPYTALSGLTIDSRNFDGSVPTRMYDLKLLKVRVPSNYSTVTNSKTGKIIERNYTGVWDGTFKSALEWTDNPAWCFYDLITNTRYGLGKYVDPSLINKWNIYEIAKYCDAVVSDTRGTYPANDATILWSGTNLSGQAIAANSFTFSERGSLGGIASGVGTSTIKEARFTCNLLIKDREEAYSVVQRMASLFRAIVYFQHGQLKVVQDKPATPTFAFNNTNVIDGTFAYSSSSAKARHTVAIVRWLDPEDLYSEKLEYVEDYDGMARYGYRELEIDGFGCTSKGQARRIGRHILTTEKFELETVSFKTGMEGATMTVGSLIKIKDSARQLKRAGGRIVSATSNTITVDSSITIPANVVPSSIKLWVELPYASQDLLANNTYSNDVLKPTVNSYSLTGVAAGSSYTTFTLSSGTFSYNVSGVATTVVPNAGNIWLISYDTYVSGTSGPTITENASVYKVLSVVENNSYEYEVVALQSQVVVAPYANKYDAIEAYSPLPEYTPTPYKLFVSPPTEGTFLVTPGINAGYSIKVSWRAERVVSGTTYKIAVKPPVGPPIGLGKRISDTSYTYNTNQKGKYYFYIYAINTQDTQVSTPLVIGPISVKEVLPQNNFDVFTQSSFTSNSITNTWEDDIYPNNTLAFELWKNSSNTLRTTPIANKTISAIDYANKTITLNNFNQAALAAPASSYRVETPIYPYVRYTAVNLSNKLGTTATTSTTLVVLESIEKPGISIGDKLFNATRSNNPTITDNPKSTNVVAVTFTNPVPGTWFTQITVSPAVTSQTAGDTIYTYKGVMGVGLTEVLPSGAIKQKIVKAQAGTNTTTIVGPTGAFTNIITGDLIVNRTRQVSRSVTKVNNQTLTIVGTAVTGQTTGDQIAIYQYSTAEARSLAKLKIDYISSAYGGDIVVLKDLFDANLIGQAKNTILVNLTRSKAAEILSISSTIQGTQVIYWPSITGAADNDEVILLQRDEVFLSSIGTYIHPSVYTCNTGTTNSVVTTAIAFFGGVVAGDILVNAQRNKCAVIATVNSTTQVTLVGAILPDFIIDGQAPGDGIFVVKASNIASSFNETLAYNHPTIYTTIATTNTTTVTATGAFASVTGTANLYMLYNATRNAYSYLASKTNDNTVVLTTPITGQTTGDRIYTFLPSTVSTTQVTAPDGAFKYARPGDLFWNKTRDEVRTILDVTTLTGVIDKKIDRITLNSAITSQSSGDEFALLQGYYSGTPTAFTDNGSNDKITLNSTTGLEIGDTISIHNMGATRVGITQGNSLIDTGLTPNTTYYYWMRVVNPVRPFVVGPWRPSNTSGDSATTLPFGVLNYGETNDTNASAILVPLTGSTMGGGKNKDSTYDISLKWEWLGHYPTIDGFTLYFWSSGSATDDATILNDEDYVKSQKGISVPRNPGIVVSNCSIAALATGKTATLTTSVALAVSTVNVTTDTFTLSATPTPTIYVGQAVRISGTNTGTAVISGYSNPTVYYIATVPTATTFTLKPTLTSTATVNVTGTSGATTGLTYTFLENRVTVASTTGLVPGQKITKTSGVGVFGSGAGLIVNIRVRGGELRRAYTIVNGGTNYSVGDIVTVAGGTGGSLRVTSTDGTTGVVTGVIVHSLGSGYSNATSVTTSMLYYAGPYILSVDSGTQIRSSVNHPTAGAITFNCEQTASLTTSKVHGMSVGDPIRVNGMAGLANINNNSTTTTVTGTDHYIITATPSTTTLAFDPTLTITGTYTASSGKVTSCKYNYTVHNITANYYFNGWGQPYRVVNTTISENGLITGDVRMIYNG